MNNNKTSNQGDVNNQNEREDSRNNADTDNANSDTIDLRNRKDGLRNIKGNRNADAAEGKNM